LKQVLREIVEGVLRNAASPHRSSSRGRTIRLAREELKRQNIDADDSPTEVKKSFDAMIEAEAAFKADLEKLLEERRSHAGGQVPAHEPEG
jgi:hypothetical protein